MRFAYLRVRFRHERKATPSSFHFVLSRVGCRLAAASHRRFGLRGTSKWRAGKLAFLWRIGTLWFFWITTFRYWHTYASLVPLSVPTVNISDARPNYAVDTRAWIPTLRCDAPPPRIAIDLLIQPYSAGLCLSRLIACLIMCAASLPFV
jgi:hypothetical protein